MTEVNEICLLFYEFASSFDHKLKKQIMLRKEIIELLLSIDERELSLKTLEGSCLKSYPDPSMIVLPFVQTKTLSTWLSVVGMYAYLTT